MSNLTAVQHALTNSDWLQASEAVSDEFYVYGNSRTRNADGDPVSDGLIGQNGPISPAGGAANGGNPRGWKTAEGASKYAGSMQAKFPDWRYSVVKRAAVTTVTFSEVPVSDVVG